MYHPFVQNNVISLDFIYGEDNKTVTLRLKVKRNTPAVREKFINDVEELGVFVHRFIKFEFVQVYESSTKRDKIRNKVVELINGKNGKKNI